jgi:hypothetical protein
VVKKRIGGNSTIEAVRVLALSCVPLLSPLTSRVGAVAGAAVDIAGTQPRLCTFACSTCLGSCEDCGAVVDISGALCWTADFVSPAGRQKLLGGAEALSNVGTSTDAGFIPS